MSFAAMTTSTPATFCPLLACKFLNTKRLTKAPSANARAPIIIKRVRFMMLLQLQKPAKLCEIRSSCDSQRLPKVHSYSAISCPYLCFPQVRWMFHGLCGLRSAFHLTGLELPRAKPSGVCSNHVHKSYVRLKIGRVNPLDPPS